MASKMSSTDEQILRATKEIVVKFIETGRVSPTGFREFFNEIYSTVSESVLNSPHSDSGSEEKK